MRTSRWLPVVFALACLTLLPARSRADAPAAPAPKLPPPTQADIDEVRKQGRFLAQITMQSGDVVELVLEGSYAPVTVANFVKLARQRFYNDLSFHRVVSRPGWEFVQGGDPAADGTGGPGYTVNLEVSPFLTHKKRALSMARSENYPDTAGSQFFICQCDMDDTLDGQYAVFGWVKSDMAVVGRIKQGDKMKQVTVEPYGGVEPCPITRDPAAAK